MKSGHRSHITFMGASSAAAACLLILVTAGVTAATAIETPRSVIYTASDFKRLADGVDPGFTGEASVGVWAQAAERWVLTSSAGTITLKVEPAPGDSTPRWQSLGKIALANASPLKVVVSNDKPKEKDAPRPVPALLCISSGDGSTGPPSLDLVRGRLDSIAPSHDTRRNHSRTNQEGVDFQAPATAAAWRDRAQHLREQMLVTLGLWPMFPKTPLTPRSPESSTAAITRSKKSCSKRSPVSP